MGYAPSTTRSVTSHLCIFERWANAHDVDILRVGHARRAGCVPRPGAAAGPSTPVQGVVQVLGRAVRVDVAPAPRPTRKHRLGANLIDRNPMLKVTAPVVPDRLPNRRYAQDDDVAKPCADLLRPSGHPAQAHGRVGEFIRAKRNAAVLALSPTCRGCASARHRGSTCTT